MSRSLSRKLLFLLLLALNVVISASPAAARLRTTSCGESADEGPCCESCWFVGCDCDVAP